MGEPQRKGMQRGTRDAHIPRAVKPVAHQWEPQRCHMDTKLMRAAGMRNKAQQRCAVCIGKYLIFRAGRSAPGLYSPLIG